MNRKRDVKLYLLFIPVAYSSYLFHEFGHWVVGEILGNNMAYSLNYAWAKSGYYIDSSHDLYVSIGGPAFTILQSIIFFFIFKKYTNIYLYPFLFFPMFMRFFAFFFGEFKMQDEARISAILGIEIYIIPAIVLLILFLIVLRASRMLSIDLKTNGYFFAMSTLSQLMVIATYEWLL